MKCLQFWKHGKCFKKLVFGKIWCFVKLLPPSFDRRRRCNWMLENRGGGGKPKNGIQTLFSKRVDSFEIRISIAFFSINILH